MRQRDRHAAALVVPDQSWGDVDGADVGDQRKPVADPARAETLGVQGLFLREPAGISSSMKDRKSTSAVLGTVTTRQSGQTARMPN